MKKVYLWAWKRARLDTARDAALMAQPLLRRMTPLQKAVLVCFHKLAQEFPEARDLLREAHAPLFLSSAFGEVGPMLRITQSIVNHDLPISPKDFQHSVLNAALSYLAMSQDWHQAAYALSGGFAGPDSTLHLAAQRLRYGMDEASIVLHAHEHYGSSFEAEAEVLILSHRPPPRSTYQLEQSAWIRKSSIQELPGDPLRCYQEDQHEVAVPWLIEADGPVLRRHVSPHGEQGWVTVWIKS